MPADLLEASPLLLPQFRIAQFAIDEKYNSLQGERGVLGRPLENVKGCPDGAGFFRRYTNGMIYWSPSTQAHEVHGEILAKWSALGFEASQLCYPVTDETGTPDGRGRFNRFERGMVYWTRTTGAHEIHGAILEKWSEMSFERSLLGYPITDETGTPDGVGRFTRFEHGMIYWTPATGANELHGAILARWSTLGFERSYLGYPKSDETDYEGGKINVFEHGSIYWWPDVGAIDLRDVAIHYTGLICFGETDHDQSSGADEPYVVLGVITPTGTSATRSRVYDDVDSGEARPDLVELYRGQPRGVALSVVLMENDHGDPDKYTAAMQKAVGAFFTGAAGPAVGEALSHLLDTGDDMLGVATLQITPKQMVVLASKSGNTTEKGVGFKLETPILGGAAGASYKVYFGLSPV